MGDAPDEARAWGGGLPAPAVLAQLAAIAHAEAREQDREDPREDQEEHAERLAVAHRDQEPGQQEAEARGRDRPADRADDPALGFLAVGLDHAEEAAAEDEEPDREADEGGGGVVGLRHGGHQAAEEAPGTRRHERDDRAVGHGHDLRFPLSVRQHAPMGPMAAMVMAAMGPFPIAHAAPAPVP